MASLKREAERRLSKASSVIRNAQNLRAAAGQKPKKAATLSDDPDESCPDEEDKGAETEFYPNEKLRPLPKTPSKEERELFRRTDRCINCGEPEHKARQCPYRRHDGQPWRMPHEPVVAMPLAIKGQEPTEIVVPVNPFHVKRSTSTSSSTSDLPRPVVIGCMHVQNKGAQVPLTYNKGAQVPFVQNIMTSEVSASPGINDASVNRTTISY